MGDIAIKTVEDYIHFIPEERKEAMQKLRQVILDNLPEGFEELMQYGMPSYSVPHSIYPGGYHVDPSLPLPFISIASQKSHIGFYHMGLYSMPEQLKWWQEQYAKVVPTKLDMGKSCVRFKKPEIIPFDLIGELVRRISVKEWVKFYEEGIKR